MMNRIGPPHRGPPSRASHIGVARVLGPSCLVVGPSSGPRSVVHGAAGATFVERQRIRAHKTLVDQGPPNRDGRSTKSQGLRTASYTETETALKRPVFVLYHDDE